jgi:DNA-binding transcriptional ArsR family regulator
MSSKRPELRLKASAPVFAALGDETRLRLMIFLSTAGPSSTATLTAHVQVTRQAVAKHLRVMKEAGLVSSEYRGRDSVWQIEPSQLAEAQRCIELITSRWDQAIERLRSMVEED